HAFRVLGSTTKSGVDARAALLRGFSDSEALVRRAAATAAAAHGDDDIARGLLALAARSQADPHLDYATRKSLQQQLNQGDRFGRLEASGLAAGSLRVLTRVAVALRTPSAADFVARHLGAEESVGAGEIKEVLRFVSEYASDSSVATVVAFVRERYASDSKFQLELLDTLRRGSLERDGGSPSVVRDWALSLSKSLLELDEEGRLKERPRGRPIHWAQLPHPKISGSGNAFSLSTRRHSSDGQKNSPLYSSFPRGERGTGVYRSAAFLLGDSFEYYCAGHDGHPPGAAQGKNYVQLRSATSHAVLRKVGPPRNDTARRQRFDTSPWKGTKGYVEIVDGDADSAYAWLAVGRFSVEGLNPNPRSSRSLDAAEIVEAFSLTELRAGISDWLRSGALDFEASTRLLSVVSELSKDRGLGALAKLYGFASLAESERSLVLESVLEGGADQVFERLSAGLPVATSVEQATLAEYLSGDAPGAETLLRLVESGRLSARVLSRPSVSQRLSARRDEVKARVAKAVEDLPDEDEAVAALIQSRRLTFLRQPGDGQRGAELFGKSCSACHQVAGKGAKIAPNLDGIGGRGLDRILEDVLAPNRNVDVSFRVSTIVTKRGGVMSGLVRPRDGNRLFFVDAQGKEQSVLKSDVQQVVPTAHSLMPSNFGESMSEREFLDVVAYLLSLRS
ncbi:MAG: c-type cytochrome, partial [Planctomycetota bacterium]